MMNGSLISLFLFIGIIFTIALTIFINKLFNKIPKEIKEKPLYKVVSGILTLLLIISPLLLRTYNNSYKKLNFDKYEAKSMLETTWRPLKEFTDSTIKDTFNNLLLPPKNIKTKNDFINLFTSTMDESMASIIYTSLIDENQDKNLTVKEGVCFYTIFDKGSTVSKAYIKKMKDKEQLVILEAGIPENGNMPYSRENIYERNENGNWILVQFSGTLLSQKYLN